MVSIKSTIIIAAVFIILMIGGHIYLPLWSTLPVAIIITGVIIFKNRFEHKRRIENIQYRINNLRSEGLDIDSYLIEKTDDAFYRIILTILSDLERSLFKLVEKNIQLLSLKEIGRNIVSSLDEQRLVDSVFDYLMKGVGYKEVAIFLVRKNKKIFQAIANIEKSTKIVRKIINVSLDELDGPILASLLSGKPFLIKDIDLHPLKLQSNDTLFPGSTMKSYLFVPLMKTSEKIQCYKSDDCLIKKNRGDIATDDLHYLKDEICLGCSMLPLLGGLLVTDGYRATSLTNIDQVTLETVGSLVSSNIENWLLYQELRQEEIFREKILEGMIHGVFAIDMSGNITLANRSARLMGGYDDEDIISTNISKIMYSEEEDLPINEVLEKEIYLKYREAHLKRKDGINIPIRVNISPLIGEDDNRLGAIILFVDMSEIKSMEEEIRQLDRLAALGRFTSAIAHEIRNPLTGIGAGIQYLNRDKELREEQKENISFIMNEINRLNRIITDLFKVARPRKKIYQKVNMANLVRSAHRSLDKTIADKEIDLRDKIDDNLPEIEVDPDLIVQVLINLIKNAAEAVDKKGIIEINGNVFRGRIHGEVVEKPREMICIQIIDNGKGMDEDEMKKIFEPFFSKKNDGTGLGLFVTHSIVQQHHGKIIVDSMPHEGTTIEVYLPTKPPGKGEQIETGSASGR